MAELSIEAVRRAWRVAYWFLVAAFVVTAWISYRRIPAGFLSTHAADLTCPALLYVTMRGLHGSSPNALGRIFAATPERAAAVLFGGSTLTELSQIWWPQGFFAGTFDPLDIVAYAAGVGICYVCEKLTIRHARIAERAALPALHEPR